MKSFRSTAAVIATLCFCAFLLYAAGTAEHQRYRTKTWRIELLTPEAKLHRSWTVHSRNRPCLVTRWSGHSYLSRNGKLIQGIYAPEGWLLECTLIEEEKSE